MIHKYSLVAVGFIHLMVSSTLFGQAKKPTIMVVPSKDWCFEKNFVQQYDNQGVQETVQDFENAMLKTPNLNSVIGKIGAEFAKSGFKTEDLNATLAQIKQERAEEAVRTTKDKTGTTAVSPLDKLRMTAKTDIEVEVYWKIESQGPRKRITEFRIKGIDAYTNQQIAYVDGSGNWASSSEVSDADLLVEAVVSKMDMFKSTLQTTFDDMFKNGREVTLKIRTWDTWDKDLESTDFGGDELQLIIENWIADNAVSGRFGSPTGSANRMDIKGIRIPLYDASNRAMDAYKFANNLKKFLITKGIPETQIKVERVGLGMSFIFLGSK